jgi:hypothetical protein
MVTWMLKDVGQIVLAFTRVPPPADTPFANSPDDASRSYNLHYTEMRIKKALLEFTNQ